MTKYELTKLIRRRRGLRVILKAIEESEGSKAAYLKILRKMLREIRAEARNVETEAQVDRLIAYADGLVQVSERSVRDVLDIEGKRHTREWRAVIKRQFGIDLSQIVRDEDLGDYLRASGARSAGLIKGLADDVLKRVQTTIYDATIRGTASKEVAKQITADFNVADSRARLIARDQMAKLNSDLNKIRHEQAGVTHYVWSTSKDERVRPRHRHLEGREYRYGESTGAEGGLPPGQPIQCRCTARGVVEW